MKYELEELDLKHEAAFIEMVEDFQNHDPETLKTNYSERHLATPLGFRSFAKEVAKLRMDWRPGPDKTSITHYLLMSSEGLACGHAVLRFPLNETLEAEGGNVLFDVPPRLRRQGFGALVLNRTLFEAVRAGLARLLLTCAKENLAARRCIELNRGRMENEGTRIHYWVPLR